MTIKTSFDDPSSEPRFKVRKRPWPIDAESSSDGRDEAITGDSETPRSSKRLLIEPELIAEDDLNQQNYFIVIDFGILTNLIGKLEGVQSVDAHFC